MKAGHTDMVYRLLPFTDSPKKNKMNYFWGNMISVVFTKKTTPRNVQLIFFEQNEFRKCFGF